MQIKQGIVIEGPKKFREKASSLEDKFTAEEIKGVAAVMIEEGYSLMETASIISFMRSQS